MYLKFICIWGIIMAADFMLEFRFEFLWPFWLVLRSIYDSFKYQGLLFSVFFVLIAFVADLICYILLPIQWLFFAASSYVWIQYVWQTERGICLGTVVLWVLFVWLEASVRLREIKTIDLCRPFAAHCIGYPMVTLGFGFKTYLAYKWRLRKQRDVRKTNESYVQLLYQALPIEVQHSQQDIEKEKLRGPFPDRYDECTSNHSNTNAIQLSETEHVAPTRDRGGSSNNTSSNNNNDIHSTLFSSTTTLSSSSSSTTTFSSTATHNNNNNLNSNSFLSSLLQPNSTHISPSCTISKRSKTTAAGTPAANDSTYNNLISTNNSSAQSQRSSKSSYPYSHTNGHGDEEIIDSYKQQKSSHLNSVPSLSSLTNGPITTNKKKERFNGQNTTSVVTTNATVNNRRHQKNQSSRDSSTHINGFSAEDSSDMDKK
ncbi:unnamed protein product [Didymodactylos carnosus]|uniref:Macoilin n=1 Tax=Didymodactylos carnosus TaxID=1234261 RepID=A0A814UV96_9BILA|nr:unnamed protein product [Didymodactylos carnosus]CAF3943891.1 unnamed protein product [Didymodactylos carnosus]